MSQPKQYGLIIPSQKKKPALAAPAREITKPCIFDESSNSSEDDAAPGAAPPLKTKAAAPFSLAPGAMERRMARRVHEKALEEDPTVFQYDELYDEMDSKREEEQQSKSKEPKKPKYIGRLLETAERRKLEHERRIERQVQKERETEGEQFKDKESFVTSAYRKKLEEMRKLQEQEDRDDYLEAIGDVTKQKDLDGFYRHLYEQKMGTSKEVQKPSMPTTVAAGDEDIAYKPINSGKPPLQRAYRKRHSSDDDDDTAGGASGDVKKVHLQNNIDADSDFSIDSSSSDSEDDEANDEAAGERKPKAAKTEKAKQKPGTTLEQVDSTKTALNFDKMKKDTDDEGDGAGSTSKNKNAKDTKDSTENRSLTPPQTPPEPPKPKKDKSEIWKKRTVGEVFDAAVQRYFERKATRCG